MNFEERRRAHEEGTAPKLKDNVEKCFKKLVEGKPIYCVQSTFQRTGIDGVNFYKGGVINCGVTMTYPVKKIS